MYPLVENMLFELEVAEIDSVRIFDEPTAADVLDVDADRSLVDPELSTADRVLEGCVSTARSATRADNAVARGLVALRSLSGHDRPFEAGRACMRAFQLNRNDRARSLRALIDIDGQQHGGPNHG